MISVLSARAQFDLCGRYRGKPWPAGAIEGHEPDRRWWLQMQAHLCSSALKWQAESQECLYFGKSPGYVQ